MALQAPVPDRDLSFADGRESPPRPRLVAKAAGLEARSLGKRFKARLVLRDVDLERNDWFYMGVADLTLAWNRTRGPAEALSGENSSFDYDSLADGRLAFYVNGRFGEEWGLKASADTREGPVEDLFTNFLDKAPESLFRRMDPDYYYPTFGDDGTVEQGVDAVEVEPGGGLSST